MPRSSTRPLGPAHFTSAPRTRLRLCATLSGLKSSSVAEEDPCSHATHLGITCCRSHLLVLPAITTR
eukprot:640530-Rhodomonas_salina.1